MQNLENVLAHYGIKGKVTGTFHGPLITQIAFAPAAGTKEKTIETSLKDIARELGVSSLRVEPISGSEDLGFEIPAEQMKSIDFSALLATGCLEKAGGELPLCLGADIRGEPYCSDLAKMPHLLVSGTTGSGKSVGLNTFILSLIKTKKPGELKLVLIDPKKVEFGGYNNLSYLLCPVVSENADGARVLDFLAGEMNRRYDLLEQNQVKNLSEYNRKVGGLPHIVCVIDEFADLIMSNKAVGACIQLLAQKARAAGIHIILSTQRPSVDVVTGVLKANLPTRLSYKVASMTDSRTILDRPGAEDLIGRGDCLFLSPTGELKRLHGAYISDDAVEEMLKPYRGPVPALDTLAPPAQAQEAAAPGAGRATAGKTAATPSAQKGVGSPGLIKSGIDMWQSLGVRRRKTIFAAIVSGIGLLLGSKKK